MQPHAGFSSGLVVPSAGRYTRWGARRYDLRVLHLQVQPGQNPFGMCEIVRFRTAYVALGRQYLRQTTVQEAGRQQRRWSALAASSARRTRQSLSSLLSPGLSLPMQVLRSVVPCPPTNRTKIPEFQTLRGC
jgi:hypothetical protein